jgi:acyl-CoA synthetase (AMP-forming)/AMP-acid ligase II
MIFKSNYPDITIPEVSLPEFVLQRAKELADKPALIDGPSGRTLTYGQLAGAVSRAAAGLAQRGFKKGDAFAIYSPNVPEYAIAFMGVASLGGINTTINPLYPAGELANQLNDSGARFLLTIPQFMDKALEAAKESKVE